MKNLEDFIKQNRELFDTEEPLMGHEQRFLNKLNVEANSKNVFTWKYVLKIAAVSLLFILSGLYVKDKLFNVVYDKTAEIIVPKNKEFAETENYYMQQINTQINLINNSNNISKEQQTLLKEEMKKVDELYKLLQKDLRAMPDDPRIMKAIIQHYQIKLQVLNRIVNDLNNLNNIQELNNPNDEKISL